jgi:two-component system sensor histidine kinase HydH
MLQSDADRPAGLVRTRYAVLIIVLSAVLIFVLTYMGIQKSRSDSLELLRQQGAALIESLALSADNAIKANSFFDLLVQEKFSDLAGFLEARADLDFTSPELADFASGYGVDAILIFDSSMNLKASGARGVFVNLNRVYRRIVPEIEVLLSDTVNQSSFRIVEGELPGDVSLYYITKSNDQRFVIAIASDALFYSQAKTNIGIGYLVQKIAREVGIEYILFQTVDGIIFSSRKIGPLLKIEKDPFLSEALASDSVFWREHVFDDRRILELVKRFSSDEYGEGVFRLGISLEKYYDIVAGYDRQMMVLSFVIFAALVFIILYLSGKQKRISLDRSFRRIRSLSDAVFDSINAGLIAVRKDGTIEKANSQFLAIFEAKEDDITGRRWDEFEFKEVISFDEILSGLKPGREEERAITVPAGRKHLLINTGSLSDPEGRLTGAVAVVYDYTRVKELEEAAQRRERLSELGDLAAGVAHEIRNPLNAISIAAQRLLGEFEPRANAEEFESFVLQIRSEANRLNEIVTRFLSMAKGGGHGQGRMNVSRVVEETVKLFSIGLDKQSISVKAEIDPDIRASVSEDRLKQLVLNLVKNGVEACGDAGGTVTVKLRQENGQVLLSVTDTGSGVPEAIQGKVFRPYFSTKEKGTGLGLSIAHQIVEEFHGQIEVFSPETGGAEFIVKFPA